MSLNNNQFLKPIARIVLPVAGSIYFVVSAFSELYEEDLTLGMIILAITGLNIIVEAFPVNKTYQGQLVMDYKGEKKVFSLELDADPENFQHMDDISLKVVNNLISEDTQ